MFKQANALKSDGQTGAQTGDCQAPPMYQAVYASDTNTTVIHNTPNMFSQPLTTNCHWPLVKGFCSVQYHRDANPKLHSSKG